MNSLLVPEEKDKASQENKIEEGCEVLEAVKLIGRMLVIYYTTLKKEGDN